MTQRYEYDFSVHTEPPDTKRERFFVKQVKDGWRLVSVTKESKGVFIVYWEKPYNG